MSFAGILGAGLLGGAANAAKGIGDRIREEAKQKRAMLLQDRAEKKAQGLAETENDNAVEAAKQRRIFDARESRLNRSQQITAQNNQGIITGANTIAAQNNQGIITGANTIAAQNNQGIITGANTIAAQNNQGIINAEADKKAHADAMEVAGIKAGAEATTSEQARAYLTSQAKFLIGGSSNQFGIKEGLTDDDGVIVKQWIDGGMAMFNKGNSNLASIVNNTFIKPFNEKNVVVRDIDYTAATTKAKTESDGWFGPDEKVVESYARTNAITRESAYWDARDAIRRGAPEDAVLKRLKEAGIDTSLF